ncbi:MAG TPA: outer membrane beta-barrel protein [Vicinamibacterales bacterium]|jgi:opacity protein-like surface antigen
MRLLIALALVFGSPLAARAELFVAPYAGIKFGGSTSIFDLEFAAPKKKFIIGGALIHVNDGIFGYEVSMGYLPGYLEADDAPEPVVKPGSFAIDLAGSALFSLPPSFTGGGLRPYAALGAGMIHVQAEDGLELFQIRRTVPVATIGGGATGLLTNSVGVRFDYRYFRSLTTDDGSLANVGRRISYSRFTVGLFLRL